MGLIRLLLAGWLAWCAGAGDFDIAHLPFLTEAWAGHERNFVHAFVFLAVAVGGAELLSRGLLIGPTSASRARAAGNDGRSFCRFKIDWLERRIAVKLAHHVGASVFFVFHLFYFFAPTYAGDYWLLFLSAEDFLSSVALYMINILYKKSRVFWKKLYNKKRPIFHGLFNVFEIVFYMVTNT